MRERYLAGFDRIWIDCLNGDKYKTGKLTPEGEPDPSVFSTEFNREGIQVGTAIALLTRRDKSHDAHSVGFRNLWGKAKRAQLLDNADDDSALEYEELHPALELGLPFTPALADSDYLSWPRLPELFPVSFPGVKTSRDDVVVDIDKERLIGRMEQYFDRELGDAEVRAIMPAAMTSTARFDARKTRRYLIQRGFKPENIVRYCYRPFDNRWLYWEPETKLLDEKRSEYFLHTLRKNIWIEARQRQPMEHFDRGFVVKVLADNLGNGLSNFFPLYLRDENVPGTLLTKATIQSATPNVSKHLGTYLRSLGAGPLEFFLHCVALLRAPAYRRENASTLRIDWPRIPLPTAAVTLLGSAEIGRTLSVLLDPEAPLETVTTGKIRAELGVIAAISREGGGSLDPDAGDLDVTAGWGHFGQGSAVMPGKGKLVERDYTVAESAAIAEGAAGLELSAELAVKLLGARTCDVYLN
ncbi:MAG: type ISP restriction/modification enzyme, partial [Candidatus Binataceae bacterium]